MIHSPPALPARKETPLRTAGGENKNPNYVRIVNSHANECCVIRRRDAVRRVQDGLAEWISSDQIQPTDHPKNAALRERAKKNDARIKDEFNRYLGRTDGHTGFISQRVPGRASLNRVAQQRNAQRASDQKAISAFWSRAEKRRGEQVEAATAVIEEVAKYGGEGAAVVAWARLILRNDAERRAAQ